MSNLDYHIPVLLHTSVDGLNIKSDGVYVDVTFGGGGHSKEILRRLGSNGKLYSFDQDSDALANKINDKRFTLIAGNFRYLSNFLKLYGVIKIDGILADLGVSSHQFDVPSRGFSIRFDSDLDMRMNIQSNLTAKNILNTYPAEKLFDVLKFYGELFQAKKIVEKIVSYRNDKAIETTGELKDILKGFTNIKTEHKFFAQIFQALRIEVNDELRALEEMLEQAKQLLNSGGRLSIISYHSLEDRIVKNYMKSGKINGEIEKDFFGRTLAPFELISKKAIAPEEKEILTNNRARSAKLRIAEKK
jgi:16S rRNA (cytosine1402-N4)-methyltransferase